MKTVIYKTEFKGLFSGTYLTILFIQIELHQEILLHPLKIIKTDYSKMKWPRSCTVFLIPFVEIETLETVDLK